jgi:hypothetical protein
LDAYQRAAELDPGNKHIQQRLQALREAQANPNKAALNGDPDKKNSNDQKTPMTLVFIFDRISKLLLGTKNFCRKTSIS